MLVHSTCVLRDFYVDDMLTRADIVDKLKQIHDENIQLLKLGTFELSKWASNCPELLEIDNRNRVPVIRDNVADSCILGMQWDQYQDTFQFLWKFESETHVSKPIVSKQIILSDVAKLFDPLGLLSPVIVITKFILQDLWQLVIQWDESVPQDIHTHGSPSEHRRVLWIN